MIGEARLKPDLEQARAFLHELDPEAARFTFQTFDDGPKKDARLARVLNGTLDDVVEDLQSLHNAGAGVFVTVNETDLKGRKTENVKRIRACFVDLDGAPMGPVTNWEPPHIIVQTSPERWHCYWRVDGLNLPEFATVQKALAIRFDADKSVHDLPRVMRLPGFFHQKSDTPWMVTMSPPSAFWANFSADDFMGRVAALAPPLPLSERAAPSRPFPIDIGADFGDEKASSAEVEAILDHISPDIGYEDWCNALMGLHAHFNGSEQGLSIAEAWSARGTKYKTGEVAAKWKGFTPGGGVSFGTVCELARQGGADLSAISRKHRGRTVPGERETDRSKAGANTAPPARSFDDLMAAAQALKPGQIEEIEALVRDCAPLTPARREAVFHAIKKASGVSLTTLRSQLNADALAAASPSPDHLDLARMTLAEIGRANILCTEALVWKWQERGVWVQQDDRAVKQAVQNRLDPEPLVNVTANLINGITDVLKSEIYKPRHQFNQGNPDVVNCLNGELELSDGRWHLTPHCRENYRTTQIPIEHDPHADAPLFEAFLGQVFRDDPDRIEKTKAVQELMGYTLMSHARPERFIMLIGPGANGKSVLLSVLEKLLGSENVAGVQPANFVNRFQRAHLHQKLANIVTELKQGEVIADAELKAITSGEPATVEHKHKDPFVMRPFSTCWFGTNHMPHTRDFSDALFRRATILQFNRTFAEAEQDTLLKEKLLTELPGILNLALKSYGRALDDGFTHPISSKEAKEDWRLEADQVALFVDEKCKKTKGAKTPVGDVFGNYQHWALQNGIQKTMSKKGLRDRLTRLGFGSDRDDTTRYVTGLELDLGARP